MRQQVVAMAPTNGAAGQSKRIKKRARRNKNGGDKKRENREEKEVRVTKARVTKVSKVPKEPKKPKVPKVPTVAKAAQAVTRFVEPITLDWGVAPRRSEFLQRIIQVKAQELGVILMLGNGAGIRVNFDALVSLLGRWNGRSEIGLSLQNHDPPTADSRSTLEQQCRGQFQALGCHLRAQRDYIVSCDSSCVVTSAKFTDVLFPWGQDGGDSLLEDVDTMEEGEAGVCLVDVAARWVIRPWEEDAGVCVEAEKWWQVWS